MARGHFICFSTLYPTQLHRTNKSATRGGEPSPTDIAQAYQPIQNADHVVFVDEDYGRTWLVKDRGLIDGPVELTGILPRLLPDVT